MAWLEQKKSGTFHIVFRIGNEKLRRTLKTKNQKEAVSRRSRIEENLRLVDSGSGEDTAESCRGDSGRQKIVGSDFHARAPGVGTSP